MNTSSNSYCGTSFDKMMLNLSHDQRDFNIPDAKLAAERINKEAHKACALVWPKIMHSVENAINLAISDCQYYAYIGEQSCRGVPLRKVFIKLEPYLTEKGYKVNYDGEYIVISW